MPTAKRLGVKKWPGGAEKCCLSAV